MSEYKVINRFKEKEHDGHVYEVGDVYPAEGKKLVKSRADFLTKVHSEYGVAFLKSVEQSENTQNTAENTEKTPKNAPKAVKNTQKNTAKTVKNEEKSDE